MPDRSFSFFLADRASEAGFQILSFEALPFFAELCLA